MRLKRREDVQWRDLPKVESPFFARAWVESNVNINGRELCWVQGLDDVVWDDLSHNRHVWDSHAHNRLIERVDNAEVFLVHGFGSDPVMPIVRRSAGEKSDSWKVEASLSLDAQFNVQRMLHHARQTRGIWAPLVVPKKAAPKTEVKKEEPEELTVTNPVWEHIDKQRGDDSPDATIAGDKVTLKVDVTGAADGNRVTFKVFDTSITPPSRVAVVRGEVEGGVGTAEWTVKVNRQGAKLEFEGEVRRVSSERAEIPVVEVFNFVFSF